MIREQRIKIVFLLIVIALFVSLYFIYNMPESYVFKIGNETYPAIAECESWNYGNISFIPCEFNKTLSGIPYSYFDWSKSPEKNCEAYNGTFVGFNLLNETISNQKYDELVPLCHDIYGDDLPQGFLSNATCIKEKLFSCTEWQKNNLIILKKN